MRRFSDRHALHTLSELNVTPLLDLAFVLLIIFMITTPLMDNSVDIILPSSNAAKNAIAPDAVQNISLRRDGEITAEIRRGYRIGQRLIRPAMVKVAKA